MRKKTLRIRNLLLSIISILCIIGLSISILKIIQWKLDSDKIHDESDHINSLAKIKESDDNAELIDQEEEIPSFDPYWDYIKMRLIDVDFTQLKTINSDVKGWIQVNGTNINYPFVQSKDNKYYLTHAFDLSDNSAGWVFLDYRNRMDDFNDKNTILYAHGRYDNTMFGSLRNILISDWLNDSDNFVIKLSTEYENTLWQVFSVYRIPTTSDYIQTEFDNEDEFLDLMLKLINRSYYDFKTSISAKDRVITLSTCYDDSDKVVLHAKLIKREAK